MLELAQQGVHKFRGQFLGRDLEVLWEKEVKPGSGIYSGLTSNYLRVFTRSQEPLTNKLLQVKLLGLYQDGIWGEVI
jgi:threonylcarbamoyladenosine tRNA methylthiotransferase MtaB